MPFHLWMSLPWLVWSWYVENVWWLSTREHNSCKTLCITSNYTTIVYSRKLYMLIGLLCIAVGGVVCLCACAELLNALWATLTVQLPCVKLKGFSSIGVKLVKLYCNISECFKNMYKSQDFNHNIIRYFSCSEL